jgi:hypothetical protein
LLWLRFLYDEAFEEQKPEVSSLVLPGLLGLVASLLERHKQVEVQF